MFFFGFCIFVVTNRVLSLSGTHDDSTMTGWWMWHVNQFEERKTEMVVQLRTHVQKNLLVTWYDYLICMQHHPCMCCMSSSQYFPAPTHWFYYYSETPIIPQCGDMDVDWKWAEMDPPLVTILEETHQRHCTGIVQEGTSVAFAKPFHLPRLSQLHSTPPKFKHAKQSNAFKLKKQEIKIIYIETSKTIWDLEGVPSR